MNNQKYISILGSTGSIGIQTLDVIDKSNNNFAINYLTTNTKIDILEQQTIKFTPKAVVITDYNSYIKFKEKTSFKGKILFGNDGLIQAVTDDNDKFLVSALVGFVGVLPTIEAIKKGKTIALANKETLVSAGNIIVNLAKEYNSKLLPIDSEHNAILQCLAGEDTNNIEKLILTASGGPFIDLPLEKYETITVTDALNHPNWSMGNKITIDSATMMNKGFEVIEAKWIFDIEPNKIDVVIHPQSIIHSLVQFVDGSIKAQLGLPDMRIPISYILNFPNRGKYNFDRLDLVKLGKFDFYKPDLNKFKCLKLALECLEKGGNLPCSINAANEICVHHFLNNKIKFVDIPIIIEKTLENTKFIQNPDIQEIIDTDSEIRNLVNNIIIEKN